MSMDFDFDVRNVAVGDILMTSWGYDTTLNDYCKVVDMSTTGKTLKCVMLESKILDDDGIGGGHSIPEINNVKSAEFKLQVRQPPKKYPEMKPYIVGTYPFCRNSTRKDTFYKYKGGTDYYNTWD